MSVATLPSNFETRNTGVFSVICLKSEPKFTLPKKVVVKEKAAPKEDSDDDLDDLFGDDDEGEDLGSDVIDEDYEDELEEGEQRQLTEEEILIREAEGLR